MAGGRAQVDPQNPLYLHPGDSLSVDEKLVGDSNYRAWRRNVEIGLASKRKLGFVTGTLTRPDDDQNKADQWDTCNNAVIAWLLSSVCDSIRKSVLFLASAREIWLNLESRFNLSNGARKYKLTRDVHEMHQNQASISEYYTKMKCVWEEIDSINQLPELMSVTTEMRTFLKVLNKQKEESKLIQFLLMGLDKGYGDLRSQLLMRDPLPSVEVACSILQQEESQRKVLNQYDASAMMVGTQQRMMPEQQSRESSAFLSKRNDFQCTACGMKGHTKERCWTVIGYPDWHSKSKQFPQKARGREGKNVMKQPPAENGWNNSKRVFNGNQRVQGPKTAANVCSTSEMKGGSDEGFMLTRQQIEHLLKYLPTGDKQGGVSTSETDDEIDSSFAGLCYPGN